MSYYNVFIQFQVSVIHPENVKEPEGFPFSGGTEMEH